VENSLIKRIEPLNWWVGMKTPLQMMIYGDNVGDSKVKVLEKGIRIRKIHKADNPNYLFLDIDISEDAAPGNYTFELKTAGIAEQFTYLIDKRRRNSSSRKSFSSADLVYLLMPDRFSNGDPSIDSIPGTFEKVEREKPFGRHGGDLQGVINHLDYLAELGVTALWMTPPQLDNEKENSYHGYSCGDYYHIDPRFGDNDLYKELVKKAHKLGIKTIMDAVPNHCGTAHWWMKDMPFNGWVHEHDKFQTSNYRLVTICDPNSSKKDLDQTVEGWFDKTMPDMTTENPYILQYFKQLYIWWIEWADLDGLRVDTFPYNEKYSMSEWTKSILEEYPNLNIVAECWHSSPAVVSYWDGDSKNFDGYTSHLPSVMDFPLQEALDEGLSKDTTEWAGGMNRIYEAVALDFLYPDPRKLMIFLDNHDTARFADVVKGNPKRIKLGLTMLATLRGVPQLYYGTEYGFRSTGEPDNHGEARRDFPGGWEKDRKNLFTGKNRNREEADIFEHAKTLFNWRKNAKMVHNGLTTHYLPDANTYAYFRYTNSQSAFIFINASKKAVEIDWTRFDERTNGYTKGVNILTGETVRIGNKYSVEPLSSIVLELEK